MEQILLTYGLHKEIIIAKIMLYGSIKVKVHSLDGETEFFDIIA